MAGTGPIAAARALLQDAVRDRVFPSAVAEAGDSAGVLWREPFGTLTFDSGAAAADTGTIFDLASLAKSIATTAVVVRLAAERVLGLGDPVSQFFEEWRG